MQRQEADEIRKALRIAAVVENQRAKVFHSGFLEEKIPFLVMEAVAELRGSHKQYCLALSIWKG